MPQETNLNVSPYFDDFDKDKSYYKVLFKPGYPVQARELTGLQSILQNQIEQFGNHIFKEGAKVIPGNTAYYSEYFAVEIEDTFLGLPVSAYLNQLVGVTLTGQTSGITAVVKKVLPKEESERNSFTLYISYINSSTVDNETRDFFDGETLLTNTTISFENTFIASGNGVAVAKAQNATSTGSAFSITSGVYFIRGYFVEVSDEIILLDQYSNKPSYRIGFNVNEEVINSDIDQSLTDNSKGFNNYAAPGADRLKISVSLFKKPLDDFDDQNFVLLSVVENGILRTTTKNTQYSVIADEFARRTYDESGNYYVSPFRTSVKESLNDYIGNDGIYFPGQLTPSGAAASSETGIYKLSPGKAIIKGYEVETISPVLIDFPKPRTTKTLENQRVVYNVGLNLSLNRVSGLPQIGVGNTYTVSLLDSRIGTSSSVAVGTTIGIARVYDIALESGSYNLTNSNTNVWDISLFDVQLYSLLTLNEPVTLSVPTYVKGKSSGAYGYLKQSVSNGKSLTVYSVTGDFLDGEQLEFDGITDSRVSVASTNYSVSDCQSIFGIVGTGNTFSADLVRTPVYNIGIASITAGSGGISTITTTDPQVRSIIRPGDLVSFDVIGFSTSTFAKVVTVSTGSTSNNTFTVSGVTTVSGVCAGGLPLTTGFISNLNLTYPLANSSENSLYTPLPKINIASADLSSTVLSIRKSNSVTITNGVTNTIFAEDNETFLPFDEERYSLVNASGQTEVLTADKLSFNSTFTELTIYNLSSSGLATLVSTREKINVKAKSKKKNPVLKLIVDKSKYSTSGIGTTTSNDGLTFGNYPFGTRVQDQNICLNVPDVVSVYGVYESVGTETPSAPKMTLFSLDGPTNKVDDLVLGETIFGETSNAVAVLVEKIDSGTIAFVPQNSSSFSPGEVVSFKSSGIKGLVSTQSEPSKNIGKIFSFENGQRTSYYDYSRIIRNSDQKEPTRKLAIYYSSAYYEDSDNGDLTVVNSYNSFDYTNDIPMVGESRLTDIIDFRPRVSTYVVSEGLRSPFEFDGRSFSSNGNSAANILAADENIRLTYSYYLPRIDKIYVTKEGLFQVKYGNPSDNPEPPQAVDDAIEIASIFLPPYLYSTRYASVRSLDYKRYRMQDINDLENRIKNLEYYTSLSLLEKETKNLYIQDAAGLDRFKSGFFVDNFSTQRTQDTTIGIKNSLDVSKGELRPSHYTTAIDLVVGSEYIVGLGTTSNTNADLSQLENIFGNNIRYQSNGIVTLDYTDEEWISNPFATRVENVTPFMVMFWEGSMILNPASDNWVDTNRLEARTIKVEGNYNATIRSLGADPQTGLTPTIWGGWATISTSQSRGAVRTETNSRIETQTSTSTAQRAGTMSDAQALQSMGAQTPGMASPATVISELQNRALPNFRVEVRTTTTETFQVTGTRTTQDVTTSTFQERVGTRKLVIEQWDYESLGDRLISRDIIPFMRTRNVEFTAKRLKPLSRVYPFFDSISYDRYIIPKLLEIVMESGTFQVGETVEGIIPNTTGNQSETIARIKFRVARSNHKYGAYNNPSDIFTTNPYNTAQNIPSSYSATSTILNIDTKSLTNISQGQFYGWIANGMKLRGTSSGAKATINNIRLITDQIGTLIGCFFIPNPNIATNPKFECGTKVYKLTSNQQNLVIPGAVSTSVEETFTASGILETVQEDIKATRNARVETQTLTESRTLVSTETVVLSDTTSRQRLSSTSSSALTGYYTDPLAQSFAVDDPTGVFITKVDLFFQAKDGAGLPLTVQIRTVQLGTPTTEILPFGEVILDPSQINISDDASVPTTITFDAPIYLEHFKEYCIVLLSNSNDYLAWISRLGEIDISTVNKPESQQVLVSTQPLLGSLFKSQNATTWTPSQYEDLKFTLYRASFVPNGDINYFNPTLSIGNNQVPRLTVNAFDVNSKQIRVGLGSTVITYGISNDLTIGNTILQQGSNASGILAGYGGTASGTLTIVNPGIGYTPTTGGLTYNNISLTSITGSGRNAKASVTITNGVAVAATITNGGSGYVVGEVLGITSIGSNNLGTNARFSVGILTGFNELILDNVQGDFQTGTAYTMQYVNNSGVTTGINSGGVYAQSPIISVDGRDGLHFKVLHRNHGMHSPLNKVTLTDFQSDILPLSLTSTYAADVSTDISVSGITTNFSTFEGVGVGTTNPGYAIIEGEIIAYTGVTQTSLTGITRSIDNTTSFQYESGSLVYKYEMNGVSLRRINKTHDMSDVTINNARDLDYYYLKLDTTQDGKTNPLPYGQVDRSSSSTTGFPTLFFKESKYCGGQGGRATQNMPFEVLTPNVQVFTPSNTNILADVRTTSGTSISSNESSFLDKGFEAVVLNQLNYFDSQRIICSEINETTNLLDVPANKSFEIKYRLSTLDERVSPVIDSERMLMITTSNRVNSVITDYIGDGRVNTRYEDPTAFQYISSPVFLENSATSLKVLLGAHIHTQSDVRVFYSISDVNEVEPIFLPFPGYLNLDTDRNVIDPKLNSGLPDKKIKKENPIGFVSDELSFIDYEFTADRIPSFKSFRIKIVLTSTTQAFVPRIRDLRVIALA